MSNFVPKGDFGNEVEKEFGNEEEKEFGNDSEGIFFLIRLSNKNGFQLDPAGTPLE